MKDEEVQASDDEGNVHDNQDDEESSL